MLCPKCGADAATLIKGRCRSCYNEYHREYQRALHKSRRATVIALLGGECGNCGSRDDLEIDHADARTKAYDISHLFRRSALLVAELRKCQLLCHGCHRRKTVECGEAGGGWNKNMTGEIPHGTNSGYVYWKCRCPDCRQAKSDYQKAWRNKRP
jgi:5-methylcytosine-specific restriction endonuclease McrA